MAAQRGNTAAGAGAGAGAGLRGGPRFRVRPGPLGPAPFFGGSGSCAPVRWPSRPRGCRFPCVLGVVFLSARVPGVPASRPALARSSGLTSARRPRACPALWPAWPPSLVLCPHGGSPPGLDPACGFASPRALASAVVFASGLAAAPLLAPPGAPPAGPVPALRPRPRPLPPPARARTAAPDPGPGPLRARPSPSGPALVASALCRR